MSLPRFVDYSLRFIAPISLGLAIYFHYQSVQERVPTYYVSPTRARIVDTSISAPPQLQVLYKGKDLNANVSAAVVYFWNDGKLPIKAEDVLEPLKIELDPACEIIDARILKVSRAVTKFTKGEVSDTAKNVLPVSFAILEHNDGAQLQIIYTGKPEARASITGTIVGAGQPREAVIDQGQPSKRPRSRTALLALALLGISLSVMVIGWAILRSPLLFNVSLPGGRRLTRVAILGMVLISAVLGFLIPGVYLAWKYESIPATIRAQQP